MVYAPIDEFHQSFVPGRYSSSWDVLLFDNFGVLTSLWFAALHRKQKRPDFIRPVVEEAER